MNRQSAVGLGSKPDDRALLIESARAARQSAAATRANVLDRRTTFRGQRLSCERTPETSTITMHQEREPRASSRRCYRFGLDWVEPGESLDLVLLVHEP